MKFIDRLQYRPDFIGDKIDPSLTLRMYEKEKNNQQWLFDLLREDDYSVCPH